MALQIPQFQFLVSVATACLLLSSSLAAIAQVEKSNKMASDNLAKKRFGFEPYRTDIEQRIKHAWVAHTALEAKKVTIVFKIQRDGKLTNLRILVPSTIDKVNSTVLKSVEAAAPFQPLPAGSPTDMDVICSFDTAKPDGGCRAKLPQIGI